MAAISELGQAHVNGRIPESYRVFHTFDIPPYGQGDLPKIEELVSDRFDRVYRLAEWFHNNAPEWNDEYGWHFVALTSIFGTRAISLDDVRRYSGAKTEERMDIIGQIAEKSDATVLKVKYVDEFISHAHFGYPGFGMLAISEDETLPLLIGQNREGKLEWQTCAHGYMNGMTGKGMNPDQIMGMLMDKGAELFVVLPKSPLIT